MSLLHLLLLLSLTNFFQSYFWFQEINAALWLYYFLFHLFTLPIFLKANYRSKIKKVLVVVASFYALIQYGLVVSNFIFSNPQYSSVKYGAHSSRPISLLHFTGSLNDTEDTITSSIEKNKPDVVMLYGFTQRWAANAIYLSDFPHQAIAFDETETGIGVFSKIPFTERPKTSIGEDVPPLIYGAFNNERPLHFGYLHLLPVTSQSAMSSNRKSTRRLATDIRHSPYDWLLIGDFQSTPFGRLYGGFARAARVDDALMDSATFSVAPKWFPMLGLFTDRIFVKNNASIDVDSIVSIELDNGRGLFFKLYH